MSVHHKYISRCLELALKGRGMVAPNPMVGAVLVFEGRIIGEGWHNEYGQAHAEVNCLESVSEGDKHLIPQCTMYVSLEPCAHQGKTPSCAQRIVTEKVKEVIVCNEDPFDQVNGKGFQILEENGIGTSRSILQHEGQWINRRFFCFHQQQRPYVILKWARTGQGYFAPLNRTRHQMSNRHSQQLVHKWRTEESAILVGTDTVLHDDPQLTARLWQGKQPLRLVLDRTLKIPHALRVFNEDAPTWIINETVEKVAGHLRYIKLPFDDALLSALLKILHQRSITSLIVEGGASLLNSFIREGLWDEARVFTTPNVLQNGIPSPLLTHADHILTAQIDSDSLSVYTNHNRPYPFVSGMDL